MPLPKARETQNAIKRVKAGVTAKKHPACLYSHEPNEETKQAMRDVDAGVGLTRCKDINDLWKKLHE